MALLKNMSAIEKKKLMEIMDDPIKWAQAFLRAFSPQTKKIEPWVARWYQVEMMRDKSVRKVYRCGRRIGKTETMVVEMLHMVFTKRNFRIIIAAPFENQVRNMFMRLHELIAESPLVKAEMTRSTKNPYIMEFANGSSILGFTTGDDAASIRGQRADWIFIDEIDFMSEGCFDVVSSIAIERAEIGITCSSTPLGKRSHFYRMCTEPKMGYSQHYHPSTHNPGWGKQMEAELRAQLTEQGYVHEVLAEFGTQQAGVFPKPKLDLALTFENYSYNKMTYDQEIAVERGELDFPTLYNYDKFNPAPYNPFRTMGVDWDKFGASSSIIILDYDVKYKKFKVIKRVEVSRGDYSYDNAVNTIVELNDIYKPAFIYCDAGAGEYQIERLHIIGEERPSTGLKHKVKRWQFSQTVDIIDPTNGETVKEPLKHLMVNQLTLSFERDRIMLSPFDTVLHKQLTNYEVERIAQNGKPVYTSKDEHFIDALGLAHLAFVLEFKELTNTIKELETSTKMAFSNKTLGQSGMNRMFNEIQSSYAVDNKARLEPTDDLKGDRPSWIKVSPGYRTGGSRSSSSWGTRSGRGGGFGRSNW